MTDLPGVKEWIDTYAPGADIRYVTLPLMRNVDEAVPATLPDFERRIGQRIWESVEAGKTKEVDVSGLSWTKIAGRSAESIISDIIKYIKKTDEKCH